MNILPRLSRFILDLPGCIQIAGGALVLLGSIVIPPWAVVAMVRASLA